MPNQPCIQKCAGKEKRGRGVEKKNAISLLFDKTKKKSKTRRKKHFNWQMWNKSSGREI